MPSEARLLARRIAKITRMDVRTVLKVLEGTGRVYPSVRASVELAKASLEQGQPA